jgi:hypothetical protein
MKKLLTIAFALILGASLSFAQATGGSTDKPADKTTETGKKGGKSGKKSHKGGKKSKKNTSDTTTTPK